MQAIGQANLLEGRWTASTGGGRFDLREAAPPWGELGSWPSSGPKDVERAVDAGERAAAGWSSLPRPERRARLLAAARRLEEDGRPWDLLARRLGLRPPEIRRHARGLVSELRRVLDRPGRAGGPAPEGSVVLCAPHWSELAGGALLAVAEELVRGRTVLLVGDPRAPMIADAVAGALLESELHEGALGVVHGLTREGFAAAIADPRVRALVASAEREHAAWLRERAQVAGIPDQRLDVPRGRAVEVHEEDDPAGVARELVEAAFGRARTLSGQRRGGVLRAYCAERCLSRFTEALLARLEESEEAADPLPQVDRVAAEAVRRRWSLGLDEGATLIFGGESLDRGAGSGGLRLVPSVFTNVEEPMALARSAAPAPVLCLLRSSGRRPG